MAEDSGHSPNDEAATSGASAEGSAEQSSNSSAQSGSTAGGAAKPLVKRRTPWEGTRDAFNYLSEIEKHRRQFRKSDIQSRALLCVTIICAGVVPFLPPGFTIISLPLNGILVCCLLYYLCTRVGVLNALSEQQAWLVWEIVLGASIFGFCVAANMYGALLILCRSLEVGVVQH
jgi:hypothetical protein